MGFLIPTPRIRETNPSTLGKKTIALPLPHPIPQPIQGGPLSILLHGRGKQSVCILGNLAKESQSVEYARLICPKFTREVTPLPQRGQFKNQIWVWSSLQIQLPIHQQYVRQRNIFNDNIAIHAYCGTFYRTNNPFSSTNKFQRKKNDAREIYRLKNI